MTITRHALAKPLVPWPDGLTSAVLANRSCRPCLVGLVAVVTAARDPEQSDEWRDPTRPGDDTEEAEAAAESQPSAEPPARTESARPSNALPTWMLKSRWPIVAAPTARPEEQEVSRTDDKGQDRLRQGCCWTGHQFVEALDRCGRRDHEPSDDRSKTMITDDRVDDVGDDPRCRAANVSPGATSTAAGGGDAQPTGAEDRSAP